MKSHGIGPVRFIRGYKDVEFYVGPYASRFAWGGGTFGWSLNDGPIVRFVRKWWSGWHRYDRYDDGMGDFDE